MPSDHLLDGNPNPIMRKPNLINDLITLQVTSTLYYDIECDNCKSILANYSMCRNGGKPLSLLRNIPSFPSLFGLKLLTPTQLYAVKNGFLLE